MSDISFVSLITDFSLIVVGLVLLYYGANNLVKGAEQIGKRFGLSALVIGVTIVAFGTSAPEHAVTIDAALTGNPDLALANIVGSNIANIGLVAGLLAIMGTVHYARDLVNKDLRFMLVAFLVLGGFLLDKGLSRMEGLVLLAGLIGYTVYRITHPDQEVSARSEVIDESSATLSMKTCVLLSVTGLLMLVFGGDTLVKGASALAIDIGVSQAVIGFTVVAIGSSLPEIATSLVAVRSGRGDIALGNIVGSNLWNSLGVLGVSALVYPIQGEHFPISMVLAMIAFGFFLWAILVLSKSLNRIHGLALMTLYLLCQIVLL